jgi:hypothetical protein
MTEIMEMRRQDEENGNVPKRNCIYGIEDNPVW